jgi:hypothetical protein
MRIEQIVDLERYPLDRPEDAACRELVEHCRTELEETGCCLLPGFLKPAAIAAALADADAALPQAHQVDFITTYDESYPNPHGKPLDTLPADHPRRHPSPTYIRFIAKDLIRDGDPVKDLFHWRHMIAFAGGILGMSAIYPYACPMAGCIFTVAEKGELQDWHFDANDFIVSLMLESADKGGHFEYVSGLRTPETDDDFDGVRRVFRGEHPGVTRPPIESGTLTIFKGRYNFHRASPVEGKGRRVMAILTYEDTPDRVGVPKYQKLFFGRTVQAHH